MALARDLQCGHFRFVGNDLPDFMDRADFAARLANALYQLGKYGKSMQVMALFNMHSSFQHRKDISAVMEQTADENVGLVYNCAGTDSVAGSCEAVMGTLARYIKHVHMHCFLTGFPYNELFYYLKKEACNGWLSIVVDEPSEGADRLIGYYARLAKSLWKSA